MVDGKGGTHIPGLDLSYSFAPVIIELNIYIVLLLWLINGWESEVIDIETALLYIII